MSRNAVNAYGLDEHVAECYDAQETCTGDLELLGRLMAGMDGFRVLEPFCGTGRLAIPLARRGHTVVGLDQSQTMLARAAQRLMHEERHVRARISLRRMDVTADPWPTGFDLVVLGGNCMYELTTPEEQAAVIAAAAGSLRPGGRLFCDGDHMEGPLPCSWRQTAGVAFPSGGCADGARLDGSCWTIWCDPDARLVRFLRRVRIEHPDGRLVERMHVQQKHPVSKDELQRWLVNAGLAIDAVFGAWDGSPYTPEAPRAGFWARKPVG